MRTTLLYLAAVAAAQPYRNASLPVASRVADLLSRMTISEMMAQLINRADTNASWLMSQYGNLH
jgi:hypothetical protein